MFKVTSPFFWYQDNRNGLSNWRSKPVLRHYFYLLIIYLKLSKNNSCSCNFNLILPFFKSLDTEFGMLRTNRMYWLKVNTIESIQTYILNTRSVNLHIKDTFKAYLIIFNWCWFVKTYWTLVVLCSDLRLLKLTEKIICYSLDYPLFLNCSKLKLSLKKESKKYKCPHFDK